MKKIAINGFGRIGRLVFKKLLAKPQVEVVAINDLAPEEILAHLLRYDSVHGPLSIPVSVQPNHHIQVGEQQIKALRQPNPEALPWRDYEVDLVIEASGRFNNKAAAGAHLRAGAKKVIISAPAQGDVPTLVLGVNDNTLSKQESIVSNASCTTNCLAPMAKVLDDAFGIQKGYISTIHAYTADQRLQDAPHKDLRRARAAALSIIPTSTGAAKAVGLVMPHLSGKLDGIAMRVPVANGSLSDLTVVLEKETNKESINQTMKKAAEGPLKGILQYTEDPIVSADIIGNPHSCIFDAQLTAVNRSLAKVIGWYDNETGYSERIAELAIRLLK